MTNILKEVEILEERLLEIERDLNIAKKRETVKNLESMMSADDFWSDRDQAVKISQQAEQLKIEINNFTELQVGLKNIKDFQELLDDEKDECLLKDLNSGLQNLKKKFSYFEFLLLFSGDNDQAAAIVSIHAGVGGVDAQDWAEILERMYLRFAEKNNFTVEIIDRLTANEAGIKTSVLRISGPYAYGNLKGENGVHRLVRISPFDAEKMRHTSFAGVEVIPEVEDLSAIEIKDQDLRIDVYRSSGPGGQSVNTTDSAVRIVHLPTNITVSCQSERSQHQNKEKALQILKARLYQEEQEKKEAELKRIKGSAGQGTWGKQIRSYVFHPYQMVKDHRSNYETSDIDSVVDGELNSFIEAYLNLQLKKRNI